MAASASQALGPEQQALLYVFKLEERAEQASSIAGQRIASITEEASSLIARMNSIRSAFQQNANPQDIEQQINDLEKGLKALKISKKGKEKSAEVDDDDSDEEDTVKKAPKAQKDSKKDKSRNPGSWKVDAGILAATTVGTVVFGYFAPGHPLYTILTMLAAGASKCLMSKMSIRGQILFHGISLPTGWFISKLTPLQATTVATALALSALNKGTRKALMGKKDPAREEFVQQVKSAYQQTKERATPYASTADTWGQGVKRQLSDWTYRTLLGAPRETALGGADNV
jgi:hypothetical protein